MSAPSFRTPGERSLVELVTTASSEPVIDASHESRLVELCVEGHSEALDTLVRANIRIAIDEAIRGRGLGERQSAMVRRGIDALIAAAERYDPSRDGAFSTHARRAVRSAIRQRYRSN